MTRSLSEDRRNRTASFILSAVIMCLFVMNAMMDSVADGSTVTGRHMSGNTQTKESEEINYRDRHKDNSELEMVFAI